MYTNTDIIMGTRTYVGAYQKLLHIGIPTVGTWAHEQMGICTHGHVDTLAHGHNGSLSTHGAQQRIL